MNNEIKEILNYWRFYINEPNNYKLLTVHFDELRRILDYITNLQQENDYYFKKNNELSTLNTSLRSDRDNYKSRTDKAIEYMEEKNISDKALIIRDRVYYSEYAIKRLLDILRGEDNGSS